MHSVYIEYVWLMLGSSHLTGGAPPHNGENEAEEEEEVSHISEHVCLCVSVKSVSKLDSRQMLIKSPISLGLSFKIQLESMACYGESCFLSIIQLDFH